MKENLMIGMLGGKKSGKSYTWNALFDRGVKTGKNLRRLYLNETEYVKVFLINDSPEKRHKHIEDFIKFERPRIILCSLQYVKQVSDTISYFAKNDYSMYIHYLNPGFYDDYDSPLFYDIRIINNILSSNSVLCIRNAKLELDERVQEIKDFIYGWAKSRDLLLSKKIHKKDITKQTNKKANKNTNQASIFDTE